MSPQPEPSTQEVLAGLVERVPGAEAIVAQHHEVGAEAPERPASPENIEINTQSMDQLRHILYRHVPTVRISDTFEQPEMAADLFEHDMKKLNILRQRGAESFAKQEAALQQLLA
jgi:hypothetical protein